MGPGARNGPPGVRGTFPRPPPHPRGRRDPPVRGGELTRGAGLPPVSRVFLTGGTGLVGSHVAEHFRSRGYAVRVLHRRTSDTGHLRRIGCELVEGDLPTPVPRLVPLLKCCDALVHAAAPTYSQGSRETMWRIHVEGTALVFQAAAEVGIRRAVHLSSVAVYGTAGDLADESGVPKGRLHDRENYAHAKREAEVAVVRVARTARMAVAVLRPSAVWGERDRLFTPRVLRFLHKALHPMPGGGRTPLALVYAGNLAAAVECPLRGEPGLGPGATAFNVSGDHGMDQRVFWARLAREFGVPFRPVTLPGPLVHGAARLLERLGYRIPGAEELSPRRVAWLALTADPYSAAKIRGELGWDPPIPAGEAIARTAAWFRSEGREGESGREGPVEGRATNGGRG